MKTKKVKQVKSSKSTNNAKLSLVIEKLEKKVSPGVAPLGSCRRFYCDPY